MNKVLILAAAALKEHSRRKLLLFFALFSLVVTGVLLYLVLREESGANQLFGPTSGIATVAALGFYGIFALIAALAVSMGNIGAAFASGEALTILARPVARWQYVMGRYFGSVLAIGGLCLIMALETQGLAAAAGQEFEPNFWGHWGVTWFNLSLVAAVTTLLSSFISIPVLTAVIAFLVNQFLGAIQGLHRAVESGFMTGTIATWIKWAWYLSPKYLTSPLEEAGVRQASRLENGETTAIMIVPNSWGLAAWAVAWLIGLIGLAILITRRKEI